MEYRHGIARYISACEAAIRILEISMYISTPSVTSINVHLPVATTTPRKGPSDLDLHYCRPTDPLFDTITLAGVTHNGTIEPGYFERYQVTDAAPGDKYMKSRKQTNPNFGVYTSSVTTNIGNGTSIDRTFHVYERQKRDKFITRIQHANATIGEQWYLRLIMLHSSPRSYEDARTVNGVLHPTFQAAARAMGVGSWDCSMISTRHSCASKKRSQYAKRGNRYAAYFAFYSGKDGRYPLSSPFSNLTRTSSSTTQ
jgi:hypothetical protein